jgi:hypothetical protein
MALEAVVSGRITPDPKTTKSLQQSIAEIAQINNAFSQIDRRTSEINKHYFQDRFILKYWQQGKGILKQIVESPRTEARRGHGATQVADCTLYISSCT